MAYPEYEELSSKDKDTFTSVCNRLLAETFVLRTLVKPGGETIRVFTGISLCNIMGMRLLAQPLISLANLMFIELISFISDG